MEALAFAIATAVFLSIVANRLVVALVEPFFKQFGWKRFWLLYISWAITSGIVALAELNLFAELVPSPVLGMILTVIVCGGGANFIADIFNSKPLQRVKFGKFNPKWYRYTDKFQTMPVLDTED